MPDVRVSSALSSLTDRDEGPALHARRSALHVGLALPLSGLLLSGCATAGSRDPGLQIGSTVSKSLFVEASQFGNRKVRLRLRNSSGDPSVDMTQLRAHVESGLRGAGYAMADEGAGIVMDANLYFMNTVATGRMQASNEVGFLLGGVTGYELSKGKGGMSTGSGAILGAIAGATLQEVLRNRDERDSYLAICDVNIGVVRQQNTKRDSFVIGGNRFERDKDAPDPTFESFAMKDTVKVYVYAGDRRERRDGVISAIQGRLANVVANLL